MAMAMAMAVTECLRSVRPALERISLGELRQKLEKAPLTHRRAPRQLHSQDNS
jgi:hypothetical protein